MIRIPRIRIRYTDPDPEIRPNLDPVSALSCFPYKRIFYIINSEKTCSGTVPVPTFLQFIF